ncbi:prenyl cysteine carboxyl methyltransferase Ste14 [Glarea lozoyensis ATCC 20868]|uniref:Protein-S-isoprenylcysteine O-methyltransferase n=1 Tax=Glarea lozoyensis (strain ATCC 20868 / MF5171) TaxID=1116229 RepID=S3D2C5_GLAL2|nr:prenyl cysteine carboxyl methyltransferase Ste14 [Glarea lozoyensis ATCC 20868]EPE32687.1 prenyl cysteine carboxyl methyltransferase Ste14 [Glarea lozoyensis ATCC 20868]
MSSATTSSSQNGAATSSNLPTHSQQAQGQEDGNAAAEVNESLGEVPSNKLWTTPNQHDEQPRPSTGPVRRNPFNESIELVSSGGLGGGNGSAPWTPSSTPTNSGIVQAIEATERTLHRNQKRSLAGIALRAFLLGGTFFSSTALTLYLSTQSSSPLWRLPFFLASLSLFHFLEFYSTAFANPANAEASSFLLSSNGWAYNAAHTAAFSECLIAHTYGRRKFLPQFLHSLILLAGLSLVFFGQIIRTSAIIQAGPSFSHLVAQRKKETHVLITSGIYSILRHPSYFGFFWWGIGTQLVLGNVFCLLGYSAVLWKFFSARIKGEEEFLVRFFKKDYEEFRKRTPVGIPYIK